MFFMPVHQRCNNEKIYFFIIFSVSFSWFLYSFTSLSFVLQPFLCRKLVENRLELWSALPLVQAMLPGDFRELFVLVFYKIRDK